MHKTVLKIFKRVLKDFNTLDNSNYALAGEALFCFVSFRLTTKNGIYILDLLRMLKDTFKLFSKKNKVINYKNNSTAAILDITFNNEELRVNYAKEILKIEAGYFYSKQELLLKGSFLFNIRTYFSVIYYFILLAFINKKKGSKINYALCLKELIECTCILNSLKKNKIDLIIDYANYEVDSNFFYLLAKELNITVYKVPSPNPLSFHNKIILGDYLILSSGYQIEEIKKLDKIRVRYIIKSMPEQGINYLNQYKQKGIVLDNTYLLGYYSHASWVRLKEKHADNGLAIDNLEEETLKIINDLLKSNSSYKLIIFLHPREKKIEQEIIYEYYSKILKREQIEFAPLNAKTAESFDLINIAILAISSILFDRLFVGRKLFIYKNKPDAYFPMKESTLNNICFNSKQELETLIGKSIKLTNESFYDSFGISNHLGTNFENYNPILYKDFVQNIS